MTQSLKIMICDDSALVRKKLRGILEELGYTDLREADNGETAVASVKLDCPHLIFMDIIMPVKNGLEALKEILEIDSTVKVVMASSVGTQTNLLEALKLGAFDFVQKPFTPDAITQIIDKVSRARGDA
jgi:two-component system chemotaxis response regulator CheY